MYVQLLRSRLWFQLTTPCPMESYHYYTHATGWQDTTHPTGTPAVTPSFDEQGLALVMLSMLCYCESTLNL